MKLALTVGVAALAVLAAAVFYSRGESMSTPSPEPSSTIARAEIETRAHLKLPDTVRNLQVKVVEGGIDDAIYLRFEIPNEMLSALVTSTAVTQPLSNTRRFVRNYTGSELAWWQPDSIEVFQSGNLIRDDAPPRYALSLLASASDAEWQTVYVFVTDL